jgi:MFS family permease
LSINALILTALFMALVLAASMQGSAASGHFPGRRKAPAAAAGVGAAVLLGSMALVTASLVGGTVAALNFIPWYAAVIGGGLSVLATPLVLQWFPPLRRRPQCAPCVCRAERGAGGLVAVGVVSFLTTRRRGRT